MPIYPLLKNAGFEPEHVEAMGAAFEEVRVVLGLKDRADPLTARIAEKVIQLGQRGVRERGQLRDLTIKSFTSPGGPTSRRT